MFSSKIARPAFAAAARQSRQSALRTYASAAESKPPVALFGIDGTYANALYTAAVKTSTLDSTASALANLDAILKKDTKLPVILHAPTLSSADKSSIVAELEKHLGGADKGSTVKNFLNTLAENNRLGLLEGICDKFAQLISAQKGEIEVTVITASKLDQKLLSRLETAVSKSEYSQGKKLKVVTKVNPDILGGLIVEVGDRTIDFSVSAKVAKLNKVLGDAL